MSPPTEPRLFGVLGDPVDHSLSPAMHNAAFAALGLPHLYLRYRVAPRELRAALDDARRLRMNGLNLTIPLKEAVLPLLDGITPEARAMGAVNTLTFRGRQVLGDNTDGRGFLRACAPHGRIRGARVLLIGAGGSARAVGAALMSAGVCELTIANRTRRRADLLAQRLADLGPAHVRTLALADLARPSTMDGVDVVINTTPGGIRDDIRLPVRYGATPLACLFVDLVYGTRRTPFLAGAERAGRPTLDGRAMLLHQGALAFERWLGIGAPRTAMARALAQAGLPLTQPRRFGTHRSRRPATT